MANEINVGYFVNLEGSKLTLKNAAELLEKAVTSFDKSSDIQCELDQNVLPRVNKYNPSQKSGAITVKYPLELFDPIDGGLSELFNVILGESFENLLYRQIRLDWVELPKEYILHFKGPKIGTEGLKRLLKFEQPPIATNIRPKIGITMDYYVNECKRFVENGVNILVDSHTSPIHPRCISDSFNKKIKRVLVELKKLKRRRPILYCPIIIGDNSTKLAYQIVDIINEMHLPEDINVAVGLSFSPANFSQIRNLSQDDDFNLPIWAHNTLHSVMTCRSHRFVVNFTVLVQFARLAGADMINAGALSAEKKYAIPPDNLKHNFDALNTKRNEWDHIRKSLYVVAGPIDPLWIYKHIYEFNSLEMIFVVSGYIYKEGAKRGVEELLTAIKSATRLLNDRQSSKPNFEKEIADIENYLKDGKTYGDFLKDGQQTLHGDIKRWAGGEKS